MDVELRGKVDLLTENYKEIKKSLRWDGDILNHYEALIYGTTEKELNLERIKEIRRYIKDKKNVNNVLKGKFLKIFSLLLGEREDYKVVFKETTNLFEHLVSVGFVENIRTAFAALILAQRFKGENLEQRVTRLINIKQTLEEENQINFHKGDYLSYANLAILNKEVGDINKDFILVHEKIKEAGLNIKKSSEGFTTALILDDSSTTEKIERALSIRCNIKSELFELPEKCYPLIGLATLIVKDEEGFAREVKEVYNLLKGRKGYGHFMDNNIRMLISIGVILNKYVEEIRADLIDVNISEEINMLLALEEFTVFSLVSF